VRIAVIELARFYDGHFHDLLNDLDKDVVMADINGWIDARLPGAMKESSR